MAAIDAVIEHDFATDAAEPVAPDPMTHTEELERAGEPVRKHSRRTEDAIRSVRAIRQATPM